MKHFALKRSRLNQLLLLCFMLFVFHTPVRAASSDELSEIRNQLRDLLERVDRLEQENQALKAQNNVLQSGEQPRASASSQSSETSPSRTTQGDNANTSNWTERVALKSDLRYRHEQISDDTLNAAGVRSTADRYRDRIRARISAEMQVTPNLSFGVGFATVEGGDPRSSNQTLGDSFSRKSLDLDLAYFDWSLADWGHLIGGKMQQPFFKPGESLFWDSDINPEGLTFKFERGVLFGSAYSYWLNEVSGPSSGRTSDTMLFGAQIGAKLSLGESQLVFAAHYYDLSAGQGRAPFFDGNPYGNTTIQFGTPTTAVLLYDFQVVDLGAEFNASWSAPWGSVPVQLWADVAQNQDAQDLDIAWAAGAVLGRTTDANTWMLGADYHSIEKDALFAQLIDADIGGGLTDAAGWILRGGYAVKKNVTVNATYFINQRNVDVANSVGQTNVDYDRLQLDLNMKF
jgi:hypothetical protein